MPDFSSSQIFENDAENVSSPPAGLTGSAAPSSLAPTIRALLGSSKRSWVRNNFIYTSTGTAALFLLTFISGPITYTKGERISFWAHVDCAANPQINVNTLGAKTILNRRGQPLPAGSIRAGDPVTLAFDGTSFRLISQTTNDLALTGAVTINAGANTSPTLALSPNNVIRAAVSSSANGGIAVTLSNANSAIVKSLIVPETGSMTFGGDIIWTSGNDGANSAMDADLLDGQHGIYYRDLANSTGTLPNARISGSYDGLDTITANRIKLLSTTDASETSTAHGFQVGADNTINMIIDQNEIIARNNGALSPLYLNGTVIGFGADSVYVGDTGNTVMHKGNDGSGSGFDADLLDGQHGSYFRDLANSTGILPNARISGNYDGIGILTLTNRLVVSGSAPNIQLIDTTSGQLSGRMRVDANNVYFDSSADDVNFAEVFRFELDAKVGYVNGSKIHTDANHNHLSIGTTAASAQSAIGINSALIGSLTTGLGVGAVGTYAFLQADGVGITNPGATRPGSALYYTAASGARASQPSGTWRCMGYSDTDNQTRAITAWLRIS
ncbi:hypothetical protein [Neorhizobium sp. NCHU2750]|uniref:hypothetical protein n=1 Tax=Neorhizobium sp. NCHU2750 TaxID=1825976 RepID=UPI000EB722A1|nr:hypothetical protein NCHU2750_23610 [Neorhizobium sp. NCHU2750]